MRPLLRPRALPPGGTVGVCAPSGPVELRCLEAGIARVRAAGHEVRCAPALEARAGYLAGSDAERREGLLALIRDPDVHAVVCARGGYGLSRILGDLDPDELRAARKPVVGYSDATALLLFLRRRAGLASVHGPMLERPDLSREADRRLWATLRGEPAALEPLAGEPLAAGRARGPLVGGSLKMLVTSLGTPWELDSAGAVLFLEEINEQPYAIDRMLVQLRDAGKLEAAAGVAVGQLVGCESERYPETPARRVFEDLLPGAVPGPVVIGLPFGHVADHRALGFGVTAELDGERGALAPIEAVVEVRT
jgi:muramoyltetrapeptide carboxypeptidase